MSFPQPNRRFSAARDLEQLKTMLDDYFLLLTKNIGLKYDNAILPQLGHALVGMQTGVLVQANANGTVRRADRAYSFGGTDYLVDANAVVVDVLQNDNVVYAPIAIVNLALGDGRGDGNRPLYLGRNGGAQVTQPTSGGTQKVGMILNYDGQSQTYLCLISPGISAFLG